MIKCHINNQNESSTILVEGHSGYDDVGKDIVCSSVSTAMNLTVNLLEKMNIAHSFSSNEEKAIMNLNIKKHTEISRLVIENLYEMFIQLNNQYPKYFKIYKN